MTDTQFIGLCQMVAGISLMITGLAILRGSKYF